jgi:hypothetical protein
MRRLGWVAPEQLAQQCPGAEELVAMWYRLVACSPNKHCHGLGTGDHELLREHGKTAGHPDIEDEEAVGVRS